jgi:uncharacterized protein YnzC (UPF0291/DUF896 family)
MNNTRVIKPSITYKSKKNINNLRIDYMDSIAENTLPTISTIKTVNEELSNKEIYMNIESQINRLVLNESITDKKIPQQTNNTTPYVNSIKLYTGNCLSVLMKDFVMTCNFKDDLHKSPCQYSDLYIDEKGFMKFILTEREKNDIGINLLINTMYNIHIGCLTYLSRNKRNSKNEKLNNIFDNFITINPYEISWSIQIYIFKMHKLGNTFIVMDCRYFLCIYKPSLIKLIKESLTRSYLTRQNAYYAFTTMAKLILEDW